MLRSELGILPCETNDPALWFSPVGDDITRAKQLCSSCPRISLCLEECLVTEDLLGTQLVGVHGGLTPAERLNRNGASHG